MLFKGFVISIKNKKIIYVVSFSFILAIFLIVLTVVSLTNDIKKTTGNILEYLKVEDIESIKSYYTEYEVTTVSNKNQNTYSVKESFLKKDNTFFKFENTNEAGSKIEYIFKDNTIVIKNYDEKNILVSETYPLTTSNLFSIYTFFSLYTDVKTELSKTNNDIGFSIENKKVQNNEYFSVILNENMSAEVSSLKKYSNIFSKGLNIKKIELVFDGSKGKVIQLNIYDRTDKMYMSIVYKTFNLNEKIDEKVFAF